MLNCVGIGHCVAPGTSTLCHFYIVIDQFDSAFYQDWEVKLFFKILEVVNILVDNLYHLLFQNWSLVLNK